MLCTHGNICSGCSWLDKSPEEQSQLKINALQEGLKSNIEINFIPIGPKSFRQRADLIIAQGQLLGFYEKNKRDVFTLQSCPLMAPELLDYFEKLKSIKLPIKKGSLRIRANSLIQGVWLDFANLDIKDLLEQKNSLLHLLDIGSVEVGQKRKGLGHDLKLKTPQFQAWGKTWSHNGRIEIPLYSCIGSFSQTGDLANQKIISELNRLLSLTKATSWLEFGCGSGNLTLPLSTFREENIITALEFDPLAIQGFEMTLNEHPEFKKKINLKIGDYQSNAKINFSEFSGVLVNPPRSGLGKFLEPMHSCSPSLLPKDFIYMSCHIDSYLKDIQQLKNLGYKVKAATIIDQFPHTPHFEILSLFQLN